LLALLGAQYKCIIVKRGSFGKNSDGGIFARSKFGEYLEKGTLNILQGRELPGTDFVAPYVIVGDEAFPLKTYLMRLYPGSQVNRDNEKQNFNYRLSRAKRVAENAFGILSQKFQIQDEPKRCIHKVNIPYYNVYTSFWDILYIIEP
jgi:hypothetical protein